MLGQSGRIGLDADFLGAAADDEGQADIIDLGHLGAQLSGQLEQGLIGPLPRRAGLG